MSTQAITPDQIEGLPPGAILRPIEGLPQGAIVRPIQGAHSAAAPAASNPYQQAAEHFSGGGTSMSAGGPAPTPAQPSFLERFLHATGIPTSQGETTTAVQNVLTPQPEPGATGLLKFEESLPVVGSDFRARADLARQGRPTSLIPFLGPAIAQFTESTIGPHPDPATALGAGANVAGQTLGLKGLLAPKAPMAPENVHPPAIEVRPSHVEALTGMIDDRAGTVDPHATASAVVPHLRDTAARMGIDPSRLSGREAGQATLKVAEQSVKDVQDEFDTIRKPYNSVLVDQSPIAAAYREGITPELQANDPAAAEALETQAKKFDQPAPLEQVNQFRTRMNRQLNTLEKRGTTAQIMSSEMERANRAAANAARDQEYTTVGRLSGLDPEYVRGLKQREGALIEAKDSLTREYNRASGAQGEAVSKTLREKVANTYPSPRGIKHAGIRELVGPKPIDVFNSRVRQMFKSMGAAGELPQYEQIQPPEAPQTLPVEGGPSGPVSGGEDVIEEATRRGPGTNPDIAAARERQTEFLKTKRENLAGQRKEVPQKAVDIRKELERPVAPAPVAGGQITPEHVAAENAFYTQARAELGASASPSAVLQRAQQLKLEAASKSAPPPVTPANPHIEIVKQGIQLEPTSSGGARLRFSMNYRGHKGIFEGNETTLGRQLFPDMAAQIDPTESQILRKSEFSRGFGAQHYGEDQGQYHVTIGFKTKAAAQQAYSSLSGETQLQSPAAPTQTLTQRVQAQPTPTLRRVNPSVRTGGQEITAGTPQQQATALMLLVKQGQMSPAEADSRIQKLVGSQARRTIRRPAGP